MLKVGDTAPDFGLFNQHNELITLSKEAANKAGNGDVIVYFYPADFTPVCTAEACAFRDNYAGVEELGIQILGISPQSVDSHQRFAETHNLPFPILSDPDKQVIRSYGVNGPLGFGVRRVTYLIGRQDDAEENSNPEPLIIKQRVVADFTTHSHLQLLKDSLNQA